jgi:Ca-activated chloride channel family protein
MVVFLTDGLPTAGITDESLIAQLTGQANAEIEARLHVFGVGYDVNSHLLDRLAAENGGTVTYVQPGENLEIALTAFYEGIARPVLTDIEIEFDGLQVRDVFPAETPDLFQGSSFLLTGRYQPEGDRITVRVRGRAGENLKEYVYHFELAETSERDFVPRLWATRRIGTLLDEVRVEGETAALVEEIRALGLAYGLVTPYTTFVIQGQAEGAASAENMALYGREDVNQAWGQTTIMARVQNQAYQQAAQADLAIGANVYNAGKQSLAQVGAQNVDLALLQGRAEPLEVVDSAWIADNLAIDETIIFGSEAYFALAKDPEARLYLQSGPNVIFAHQGQVIAVQEEPGQSIQGGSEYAPKGGAAPGSQRWGQSLAPGSSARPGPDSNQLQRLTEAMLRFLDSLRP